MLPSGMQVAEINKRRKRRRVRNSKTGASASRTAGSDPLKSYEGAVTLDGVDGVEAFGDEANDAGKEMVVAVAAQEKKIFMDTDDGLGRSTSGRNAWKQRHRKGKFSKATRKWQPNSF